MDTTAAPSSDSAVASDDFAIDPTYLLALLRAFLGGTAADASCHGREEAGCALWDLSAGPQAAELLVHHKLIDVIQAVLDNELCDGDQQEPDHRIVEVALGIVGNLCTHDAIAAQLHDRPELVARVMTSAPWLPDPGCISELCRLLSVALRKPGAKFWMQHLTEPVLSQLLFICVNTLEPTVLERCLDSLVAIVHADREQRQDEQQDEQHQHQPGADSNVGSNARPQTLDPQAADPSTEVQGTDTPPTLTPKLLSLGLLDISAAVLSSACRQAQRICSADTAQGTPFYTRTPELRGASATPLRPPGSLTPAGAGLRGTDDKPMPGSGEGTAAQQQQPAAEAAEVIVGDVAVDAVLRLVEELAAMPEGRQALLDLAPKSTGQASSRSAQPTSDGGNAGGRGASEPGGAAEPLPARGAQEGAAAAVDRAATQLPSLLLELLALSDSSQVLESLVIALLDLPGLVLPLLLADVGPLNRLVDVVVEMSEDTQEQVIAAAWYLTAATMQECAERVTAAQRPASASEAPATTEGRASVSQARAALEGCHLVVRRLQQLSVPESCQSYEQRCLALQQAML